MWNMQMIAPFGRKVKGQGVKVSRADRYFELAPRLIIDKPAMRGLSWRLTRQEGCNIVAVPGALKMREWKMQER